MGLRTRLDELLRNGRGANLATTIGASIGERLGDLRDRLPENLKGLSQEIWKNPRALSDLLEEKSPWLSRQMLGAASNVAEPFVAGMGLQVVELGEDSVTVSMPGWWRNQGEAGFIHAGAICTLAEFAARIYWEHHLDLSRSEMTLRRLQLRPLGTGSRTGLNQIKGNLRARYHMQVAEREGLLHQLRADGQAVVEGEIAVYDEGPKLVAQLEVEWHLQRQLAIGARP